MVVQDVALSCMSETGRAIQVHIEAEAEAESREWPDAATYRDQKLLERHGSNKRLESDDAISFRHALNMIQSQKLSDRSIVLKMFYSHSHHFDFIRMPDLFENLRCFALQPGTYSAKPLYALAEIGPDSDSRQRLKKYTLDDSGAMVTTVFAEKVIQGRIDACAAANCSYACTTLLEKPPKGVFAHAS